MGQFFCEFWLFSRENPAKSADFSANLPLKIPRNFAFFPRNIRSPANRYLLGRLLLVVEKWTAREATNLFVPHFVMKTTDGRYSSREVNCSRSNQPFCATFCDENYQWKVQVLHFNALINFQAQYDYQLWLQFYAIHFKQKHHRELRIPNYNMSI